MKTRNDKTVIIASAALSVMLVLGGLFAAVLIARPAGSASAQNVTPSQITVVGSGSISAQPDILHITIGVTKQDTTVKAAQSSVDASSATLIQALKDAGIADKDYATSQYSIDPVLDYSDPANANGKLTGYRVTITYDVTVRDLTKASSVIDSLTTAGANTIYGTYFTFSDPNAVGKQAYGDAMKDATDRATTLASLSNMTLGRILSVSEQSTSPISPVMMKSVGASASNSGIVPGQQTITTSLVVVYETVQK